MKRIANHPPRDLFSEVASPATETLGPGAMILRGFVRGQESSLLGEIAKIVAISPFRHLVTPGGFRMSVAMTNCGEVGWVSDRTGYRYDPIDPETGGPWPALPDAFLDLARTAAARAGFDHFAPDACLINRYEPGTKLSLHRDYDERDVAAPIVSVSIGVPATFQWGGLKRNDRTRRVRLESGDVVVWGGESRFVYHGIAALAAGDHPATGSLRINLTFRKAR
jgi:alkylated DNA repair protein (DNA oxidative demethylase)